MRDYFMTTERLGFSTWTPDDLKLMHGIFGDPEVTVFEGGPWSSEQVERRLQFELSLFERYRSQYWPLFLIETGEHVGCCGMRPHDMAKGAWEFGCQLRRAVWCWRLGREAGAAGLAFGV